jgi:hypothetical protein
MIWHGTSRSWLVKGQEGHIHVHCGWGFACPSGCLVISFELKILKQSDPSEAFITAKLHENCRLGFIESVHEGQT